jgi:hypothetical protein
MASSLSSLISLYSFSTGRRLFAFRQLLALTQSPTYSFPPLTAHLNAAIAHDNATRDLERRYATTPATSPRGLTEAKRVDILVDRTLSAIRDAAVAQANGADPGDPIIATSEKFVRTIFPKGLNDMTSLGFVEELSAVQGIVTAFQAELAPVVAELGLGRLAKRLTKLAVEYDAVLNAPDPEVVGFGEIRAARAQGQQHLLQAVAQILGKHWQDTPEDVGARAALLAPILKQNEAIRQSLRAHRAVEDIDPVTGEINPSAPVTEPVADDAAKP